MTSPHLSPTDIVAALTTLAFMEEAKQTINKIV